ncbi:hypothetical protein RIF29_26844 [Crotalaria pallida]|uniref:Uncharacterized protein n=1 Tax=Crotalaria pallida TaxID=3830 RepID=A0AAN9EN46_CROPI
MPSPAATYGRGAPSPYDAPPIPYSAGRGAPNAFGSASIPLVSPFIPPSVSFNTDRVRFGDRRDDLGRHGGGGGRGRGDGGDGGFGSGRGGGRGGSQGFRGESFGEGHV